MTQFDQRLFFEASRLLEADINNNPVSCGCKSQWIRSGIQNIATFDWVKKWENLTCGQPISIQGFDLLKLPIREFACTVPKILSTDSQQNKAKNDKRDTLSVSKN